MDFQKALKILLAYRDMTQAQFAAQLDVTPQALNDVLRRPDHRINADITKYADALGYDVKVLFVDRQTGKTIDCD